MRLAALICVALTLPLASGATHGLDISDEELQRQVASWPRTCEEAVQRIVTSLDNESIEVVKSTDEDDLIRFHHGWGTGIRNEFGLWSDNHELSKGCAKKSLTGLRYNFLTRPHPDDVSMEIITRVWHALHGVD